MPNFNPNAAPFIPTFMRHSGATGVAAAAPEAAGGAAEGSAGALGDGNKSAFLASSHAHPVVFLMFGCRGAGKTTQSELLAKEYNLLNISSGTIYREGKQPFVELRRILLEEFSEGKERRYNGVVLDRFVANSEFDAFYVQSALNAVKLPIPFVFMLAVDPGLAAKRAESRGDNKFGHQHWRAVEQKAQAVTANTIYAPIGRLKTIRITDDATIENVFKEIKSTIETELPVDPSGIALPSAARREVKGMRLIGDYETYMKLAADVHAAVGNTYGRRDSAPLSSIGAYLDKEYFSYGHKNLRSLLSTFHVTLKADGERYLLVKHKEHGYIGFPAVFTHCYDMNGLFEGVEMRCDLSAESQKAITRKNLNLPVEFLLDTELVIHDGQPTFYVLDYVYFWGLEAKKIQFESRLKILREYFGRMASAARVVLLKDYVPINKLRTLIPKWKDAHLPIDGLVFQHNDTYRIGRDKFLVKWKPVEQCTVDFRLANGVAKGDEWTFELMVSDDATENSGFGEILYPGAVAPLPAAVVKENHLCNGMIVELFLERKETEEGASASAATRWSFRGVRNDKPAPNKYSIVKKIVELKHLDLEELTDLCEKVPFYGTL
ncbi:putative RNA guanylyltransferase [Trypanosoma grayi]|uniref:putative RNA guanylyltransferase n=1 Tax=Trypanosoma grayi TaxID=71804 RepID=UPI0004F410CC|nr:putative RNA guanylyltransferase [Trypanosoma grayi]KEG10974.1 putative RNA guanylyltransferase [Trypanosoma grayi]